MQIRLIVKRPTYLISWQRLSGAFNLRIAQDSIGAVETTIGIWCLTI